MINRKTIRRDKETKPKCRFLSRNIMFNQHSTCTWVCRFFSLICVSSTSTLHHGHERSRSHTCTHTHTQIQPTHTYTNTTHTPIQQTHPHTQTGAHTHTHKSVGCGVLAKCWVLVGKHHMVVIKVLIQMKRLYFFPAHLQERENLLKSVHVNTWVHTY